MSNDLTTRDLEDHDGPPHARSEAPGPGTGSAGSSLSMRVVPVVLVMLMFAGVSRQALQSLTDPDIWWHLRMGDELTHGWDFGRTQAWTPFATAPWVRTQWLPEILQSWMNSAFGLPGVAFLFGVCLIAIVAMLYVVCRRHAGPLAAAVATAVGFIGMSATLSPRPQLVSFALILVFVGAWLQTARDLRPRWWLVPLTWIWACSHGMWFVGPVIGLTVAIGLVADRRVGRGQAFQLFLVPVLGFVAAGLTPTGPQLLRTPFAVGDVSGFITEWAAPSIRETAPAVTFAVIAIVVLLWTRGRRVPGTHVGLLLLAMTLALLSARTVTLGAAITAPLFAGSLQTLVGERGSARKSESGSLGLAALVCAVILAVSSPSTSGVPGSVPLAFDAQLDSLPPKTVILNQYVLGGWLLWRHPSLRPVVDGRTEAYPVSYLSEYGRATEVSSGWQGFVRTTGAQWAVLQSGSPLATALIERQNWRPVATDQGFVLLSEPHARTGSRS